MSGTKLDDGKNPLDLIATDWVEGTGRILQFGAQKYAAYNWSKGMKWSRVFSATLRHLYKWWRGEDIDPETGESHLYHASCNLMFLSEYELHGLGEDDRPTYMRKTNARQSTSDRETTKSERGTIEAGGGSPPFCIQPEVAPARYSSVEEEDEVARNSCKLWSADS